MSSVIRIFKASPIEDYFLGQTSLELPMSSSPEPLLLPPPVEILDKSSDEPKERHLSDADLDLQQATSFFSALGLAITILGLIQFVAPTSGKVSKLIGFVQSLMGSIVVALSL